MTARHWRDVVEGTVETEDQFCAALERLGICFWTPMPRLDFPNLAEMMSLGGKHVFDVTWFWKDDLHEQKRLFYGKLLGGKPTFVSMELLPALIAARGDLDPHNLHEQGQITDAALRIYEALARHGELSARDLRREAKLAGAGDKAAFDKGLEALTALFQICKTGITGRTRGTYGYIWGLVENWTPETLEIAAALRPMDAAQQVVNHLAERGAALQPTHWRRMFGWEEEFAALTPTLT